MKRRRAISSRAVMMERSWLQRSGRSWEPDDRRLGHATPVLTLTTYGHLFKTDDRTAAIMEAALTI
jgi:hypothetical protein